MQRRHFMKLTGLLATLPAIKGIAATSEKNAPSGKQLYEWRIYTLEEGADGLDNFFRDILIPAYNRKSIKAGAFTPYKKEEKERRLLLFIYPDIMTYHQVKQAIWDDAAFRKAAQPYFDKTAPNPAYFNFESFLCEAFDQSAISSDAGPRTGRCSNSGRITAPTKKLIGEKSRCSIKTRLMFSTKSALTPSATEKCWPARSCRQ